MRLRWKLNLFASGFCALGSLFGALAGMPLLMIGDLVLAYLLWTMASRGIETDLETKGE